MSLFTRTDVTAVKFYRNLILAGVGGQANIFDRFTAKRIGTIQALKGQNIHQFVISKCGGKILVFGGKQFAVLIVDDVQTGAISLRFDPVLCNDWVHAAVWLDQDHIALLTAHNVVQKWSTSESKLLSSHTNSNNSILYSALLLSVEDDLIVFAGTVFSEVIIHWCTEDKTLHSLTGHKGVIFSILCDAQKQIIVTTSDDRSVRVWAMSNTASHHNTKDFWNNTKITCNYELYGHTARVMRSFITNNFIISCGEDAAICYWNCEGKLIRKVVAHQMATIWSIDGDETHIVTGGGDGGIVLHPVSVALDYYKKEQLEFQEPPKHMAFTARHNLVMINDGNDLVYYYVKSKKTYVHKLFDDVKTYKMLSLTPCKQIIAVSDMNGNLNVYVENCKEDAYLKPIFNIKLGLSNLMSSHWAGNRHLVMCTSKGDITVLAASGNDVQEYAKFSLPPCKDKYLTAATINPADNMIICGDRNGNIHCFLKGSVNPVKTFKKVHGCYGPTSITVRNNEIVTTGRDGTIKYHSLSKHNVVDSKLLTKKNFEFPWVEKFLDKDENIICGFKGKTFVVHSVDLNATIFEVTCGGGHRAWDALRCFEKTDNNFEEFLKIVYVKASHVYLVAAQVSKIAHKDVLKGSHSKIIQCMTRHKSKLDDTKTFYVSGGEDTTLRVSSVSSDYEFKDEFVFKHLSNVRTVKSIPLRDNRLFVISAGGRAQICINMLKFENNAGNIRVQCQELVDYMLNNTYEERRRQKNWREHQYNFDPETRVMDIDAKEITENKYLLFAGCSDTYMRLFSLDISSKDVKFELLKELNVHKTCILKTVCININHIDLVFTGSTRGEIIFWNVIYKEKELKIEKIENDLCIDNSGINSVAYKVLMDKLFIAIGGDNNSIDLFLFAIEDADSEGQIIVKTIDHQEIKDFHCSQINGLALVDDLMISASIDQRVTLCRWRVCDDRIFYSFIKQAYSDVADIQGLEVQENSSDCVAVFVFGKGFQVLKLDIPKLI